MSEAGLAAFVISYRRPEALRTHLAVLREQSFPPKTILVVDNASDADTRALVLAFASEGSLVRYLDAGDNIGPAGAAALALALLAREGYTWILWCDDDDPPPSSTTLEELVSLPRRYGASELVGAVSLVGGRWDWGTGQAVRIPDKELTGVLEVDVAGGNQQLLIHRRAVERVGLPRAELFFGLEEPEYCLRIRRAGLRILVDGDLMRRQREVYGRIGLSPRPRRLGWGPRWNTLWRAYYSTRNYVYMMRQGFGRPDLARREVLRALARSLSSLSGGPRYFVSVSMAQARAVRDGYRGVMGRTVEPRPKMGRQKPANLDSMDS